jgi:hypothetical protein
MSFVPTIAYKDDLITEEIKSFKDYKPNPWRLKFPQEDFERGQVHGQILARVRIWAINQAMKRK